MAGHDGVPERSAGHGEVGVRGTVHARREVAERKEEDAEHRRLRCGRCGRGRRDDGYGLRRTEAQGGCSREAELRGHSSGKKG